MHKILLERMEKSHKHLTDAVFDLSKDMSNRTQYLKMISEEIDIFNGCIKELKDYLEAEKL